MAEDNQKPDKETDELSALRIENLKMQKQYLILRQQHDSLLIEKIESMIAKADK